MITDKILKKMKQLITIYIKQKQYFFMYICTKSTKWISVASDV